MPKNTKKLTIYTLLALIFAEILWGANKPIIKLGLETVPLPIYLSVTVMGAALLIAPLALRDWRRLSLRDYMVLIVGSVISITVGNVALLLGLEKVPAVNASLIGLLAPLLLYILSIQFLREKLSLKTFLGVLIAFSGAAIIIGKPWEAFGSNQIVLIGNMFILLAVLCDIVGTLVCKPILRKAGTYQVTFIHLFTGILPVAVFSFHYLYGLSYAHAGTSGYVAIVVNIIAITIANCLFMYGLKHKKAQEVGVFQYINPLTTILVAYVLLAEIPDAKTIGGAALIFLGVYLTSTTKLKIKA